MATTMTATIDPQTIVRDAIKKLTTLATLPEVTSQIISTVEDPKSSATRLHKLVSHDPALVTRILKVVNSAFYGLPGQVGSIERAIVLLGLNAVKNIAVAASLGQLFRGAKLCDEFTAKDLWTHCVSVGLMSRELARALKLPIADEAFLAGMIHDVGILVELQTWPEQIRAVCQKVSKQGGDFCQAERDALGIDHQMMGRGLAEHWKFPKACQQVAGFHHNPAELHDESRTIAIVVYVADVLCCNLIPGFNLTAKETELDPELLAEIKLDPQTLEKLKTTLPGQVKDAMNVFA